MLTETSAMSEIGVIFIWPSPMRKDHSIDVQIKYFI